MLTSIDPSLLPYAVILAVSGLVVYIFKSCYDAFTDPLKDIPGPFWARVSRLWELGVVREGAFQKANLDLHEKYGPIVRIAPGKYSINDPADVKTMYGHGTKFTKSGFYHAFGNPDPEFADTFSERDIKRHALKRRKIASLYSMTNLLSYESFVDEANATLCQSLQNFAKQRNAVSIPQWMQFYAFDVIGLISVGEPFGFLQRGNDFNGILRAIHENMAYGSCIGLFPELHPWLGRMATAFKLPIPFTKVIDFITHHRKLRESASKPDVKRQDFMTKLLSLMESDKIGSADIINSIGANVAAGSDTTGLSLSTVVYMLAKHPNVAVKLQAEIKKAEQQGAISEPATFQETQQLLYLQAVIKEALRIHPATGQPLLRVVPEEGATLHGRFLPRGTQVGTSPWLIHFDKGIYGDDAFEFRPERWLEDKGRAAAMDSNLLAFGAGARTCLGKNISMLEMSKVIPQMYRKFNFRLETPDQPWELNTVWFVKQKFRCYVEVR